MGGTLDMEETSVSMNAKDEAASAFSDEHSIDADTIDYDVLGDSSSSRRDLSLRRQSDKPMLGGKISNTFRWKLVVIVLMFVNTTIVVIATSLYLGNEASKEFEKTFNIAITTVADGTHYHMKSITNSLDMLGETIISYCLDTDAEWPYVTLPGFEQRVGVIRRSSLFNLMGFLPLVETTERELWEAYAEGNQEWIQDSYKTVLSSSIDRGSTFAEDTAASTAVGNSTVLHNNQHNSSGSILGNYSISPTIVVGVEGQLNSDPGQGPYAPVWQMSPPPPPTQTSVINTDLMSLGTFHLLFESFRQGQATSNFAISHVVPASLYPTAELDYEIRPQNASSSSPSFAPKQVPSSFLFRPIFGAHAQGGEVQGFVMAVFSWQDFFSNLLPDDIHGIVGVLRNPCNGQAHMFQLQGRTATFLGDSDMHDKKYDHLTRRTIVTEIVSYGVTVDESDGGRTKVSPCHFEIDFYASAEFSSDLESNGPLIFTVSIAFVFVGTGVVFLVYVYLIGNRQNKVLAVAASTSAIVSSLFPSTVRDRILKEAEAEVRMSDKSKKKTTSVRSSRRNSMKQIQENRMLENEKKKRSKPNADLFPETTVLFADIVGFTAWSSVRDPTQVFELLETIYHSFDQIARRRRVFKVETIGDCYVAVTGLPQPCRDHAVNMCRFARDCLHVMEILTKKLEVKLGPDTGELSMRFGLHSGPVTAGVLRGERSRFQLFGDTVNTAARMESNGMRERIHISEQTAEQLRNAGKADWFVAREDKIIAKGKGELQTYWLHTKKSSAPMSDISNSEDDSLNLDDWLELPTELFDSQRSKMGLGTYEIRQCLSEQNQRLADWNSNQLLMLLNNVVAHRKAVMSRSKRDTPANPGDEEQESELGNAHAGVGESGGVLTEAADTIELPRYDGKVFVAAENTPANLSDTVQQQLHDFVSILCSLYVDHPFHNYQHASHVTMSIIKLLSSLGNPHHSNYFKEDSSDKTQTRDEEEGERFHSKTFGISSDPMTHFALAFASLIHDVDHPGVSNSQLAKEKSRLARVFGTRCIAEQNSFQCAWDLLMDPSFNELRAAIYTSREEYRHFRQVVVNAVISTDLFDKELNEKRQLRWDTAFPPSSDSQGAPAPESSMIGLKNLEDLQATVVIEYMVQASDVAHTMQHWHVYRKWNERLFNEQLKSYKAGRLDKDPREFWYQNELDFFDNTVIPIARKLKSCGAFQVYFDEYLSYATQNRQEWELKGHAIVNEMYQTFEALGVAALSNHELDDTTTLRDESDYDAFTRQN